MRETGLTEVPTRDPWAIRAGLVAGALTLVLRLVGVVAGPVAVALAIAAIVFLPGPKWWADRFLVAAALLLGWLPVLGWIPKLGGNFDFEGVLLAVAVGFAVAHVAAKRRGRREERERITPAEALAVVFGAAVALWWAIPMLQASTAGRLRLFLPGWDNPRHLSLIRLNLKLGSFVPVQPNSPAGIKYDGGEYPQGWHQMWAQWVRLWDSTPSLGAGSLVDIYSVAVVVTAGLAVMLGCVAAARLCRGHAFATVVSMSVVAQLFAVGVLSISVYFGFPNIGIALVAVAVAPSILMRPSLGPPATFFVVSGLTLVGVYNWWPLSLLVAPTLAVATFRLWRHVGTGRPRLFAAGAIAGTAVAMAAPVLLTLHLGSSHLLIDGGIPPTPWWLVFASAFALIAVVIVRQVLTHDTLVTFVFGAPAALGAIGVIALIAYDTNSTKNGLIGYYGQKLGALVAAASLIGLALLLTDALSRFAPKLEHARRDTVLIGMAAVVASVAVFQVSGYVGPSQGNVAPNVNAPVGTYPAAPGFLAHEQWSGADDLLDPLGDSFLASVDATTSRIEESGEIPELWSYVDIEGLNARPDWTDLWFACLLGGLDTPRLNRAYSLYALNGVTDPVAAANALTLQFAPASSGQAVKLIVPQSLAQALVQSGAGWVEGVNVFVRETL